MNNKHSFRTSVRYLIPNTKCVLEHNKRRKELQEKLSRAKEAKTNPNVGANTIFDSDIYVTVLQTE